MEQILIFIEMRDKSGGYYTTAQGEFAFEYRGFRFYVHGDDEIGWRVSDALIGAVVSRSDDREKAVSGARKNITEHFKSYIQQCKIALYRRQRKYRKRFRYNRDFREEYREGNLEMYRRR